MKRQLVRNAYKFRRRGTVSWEVAEALALEHYEKFNRARLADEAEQEVLDDDEELKRIQDEIEKKDD